jgi:hypothetical protein
VDVNYEVFWDYLVLILADVFRTQLHLACLDIITSLDKCRVEHYTTDKLIGKACMLEHDFYITLKYRALLSLTVQKKDNSILFLTVLFLDGVRVYFLDIKSPAAINFKKRDATST